MKHLLASKKGFTLIEIMIAITIMATLSLLTANTLQSTIKLKRKVQAKVDRHEKMRSALKIIKKDIEMAYHYYNYNLRILDDIRREIATQQANKKNKQQQQQNQNNQQSTSQTNTNQNKQVSVSSIITDYINKYKKSTNVTNFLGSENEIYFTSANHVRRFQDAQESNLMEVGYYLKNCRSLLKENERSQCLWRRTTPFLDEKTEEGGGASVLMEHVKSLKFSYYYEKEAEWLEKWFSNESGDDITRGNFPSAVKVQIEVEINKKPLKEQMVVALAFPNNPPVKKPVSTNQQGSGFPGVNNGP